MGIWLTVEHKKRFARAFSAQRIMRARRFFLREMKGERNLKHNKYFKTQLAAAAAIAFISCYSFPFRNDLFVRREDDIKSFIIACQRRRKRHR